MGGTEPNGAKTKTGEVSPSRTEQGWANLGVESNQSSSGEGWSRANRRRTSVAQRRRAGTSPAGHLDFGVLSSSPAGRAQPSGMRYLL